MVVKTETCFYTELKIYPGHGSKFVRRDGKLINFIDGKSRSLYHLKIKAQRLCWTQAWRRLHKKGKVETHAKKKAKRSAKVYKSIQGVSLEDIRKRRAQKPDVRKAQRETALREVKEKAKKQKDDTKKKAAPVKSAKKAAAHVTDRGFVKTPKIRQQARAGAAKTGSQR